jgi:alpha/beta superfamily hydrolase
MKTDKNSLLAVQMLFKDRGESQSSGKELKEELAALQSALEFVNYKEFERLHFIGKSLGGIIFSQFLKQQPTDLQSKSRLTILGYIYGDAVIPPAISGINIIQGENDKYGTPEQVQSELEKSGVANKVLNIVKGADHSYRNTQKEPEFQDKAVELI